MNLKFESLEENHNRVDFNCGEAALNHYIRHLARQDMRRELARTFILRKSLNFNILGYYALRSSSIQFDDLPKHLAKNLPKYPIPMARLARLAVEEIEQGKGYGELLLTDALYRTSMAGESLGIYGMLIDAKHEKAKHFYQRYGFKTLTQNPLLLLAPLKRLRNQFIQSFLHKPFALHESPASL